MAMRAPRWLFRQRVTLERLEGSGAYGPVYAAPVEVLARIEPGHRLVRDRLGQEVVAMATAYLPADVAIGVDDRLTWDGRTYTVIEARAVVGPSGRVAYREAQLR